MEIFTHTFLSGQEHKFAWLSVYDLYGNPQIPKVNGFVPLYRQQLKKELIENLKLAGIPPIEWVPELNGFDQQEKRRDQFEEFMDYIKDTSDAFKQIVTVSYVNANGNQKDAMGNQIPCKLPDIPEAELVDLCWKLLGPIGISKGETKQDEPPTSGATYGDGGTDDPNLPPPMVYQQDIGGETGSTLNAG